MFKLFELLFPFYLIGCDDEDCDDNNYSHKKQTKENNSKIRSKMIDDSEDDNIFINSEDIY